MAAVWVVASCSNGSGGGKNAASDPIDPFVGIWKIQSDSFGPSTCPGGAGTPDTRGDLVVIKTAASSGKASFCNEADAGCSPQLRDLPLQASGGSATFPANLEYQAHSGLDCTMRQTAVATMTLKDGVLTAAATGTSHVIGGTQCAEAETALQHEHDNTYTLDGCSGSETMTLRRM